VVLLHRSSQPPPHGSRPAAPDNGAESVRPAVLWAIFCNIPFRLSPRYGSLATVC